MTINELLREEEIIFEAQTLPGRERLITSVYNILKKLGKNVSRSNIASYEYYLYKQWKKRSSKVKWILAAEKKAVKLGFDPRKYDGQKPGDSSGVGKAEHDGRAYFFTVLRNGMVKHYTKKDKKEE